MPAFSTRGGALSDEKIVLWALFADSIHPTVAAAALKNDGTINSAQPGSKKLEPPAQQMTMPIHCYHFLESLFVDFRIRGRGLVWADHSGRGKNRWRKACWALFSDTHIAADQKQAAAGKPKHGGKHKGGLTGSAGIAETTGTPVNQRRPAVNSGQGGTIRR